MKKEELYYIQILKDHLHKNKTEYIEGLDWDELYKISSTQNTNGIVFSQCKSFIPEDYFNKFNNLFLSEIYNYGIRKNYTDEI